MVLQLLVDQLSWAAANPLSALSLLVGAVVVVAALALVMPLVRAGKSQRTPDYPEENYFRDVDGNDHPFPRIFDEPTLFMSLVVPAYNEQDRLPDMLQDTVAYLDSRQREDEKYTWEIIIVDDGSKDRTCEVAMQWIADHGTDRIRLLKLRHNLGKGGAVRKGMMRTRGEYILMVDADGATVASELGDLEVSLGEVETNGHGIAVGSRAHLQQAAVAERKWYRNVLMYGFHALVYFLCGGHGVQDTQCGFKLFTRDTARVLFSTLHIERWAFDVELLFVAARLNIRIAEVAVKWTEIDGSKLSIFASTFQMLRDLVLIRLCYLLGVWRVETPSDALPSRRGVWKKKHK